MNFEKWMRARFRLFIGLNILLMVVWSIYLFAVQVLDPHNLEQQRRLRYTPVTEVETALRGFIYDRNENLLVRTSRYYQIDYDKSSLWHYKKNNQQELRKDYDAIATTISKHSNLSKQYVLNRLNRTGSASVYLSDKVRETELINIERELKELGYHRGLVTKFSSQQRNYTQGELGSRLLGSVREIKDQNTGQSVLSKMEGLSGIESAYDKELKGVYGWYQKFLDGHNNPIAIPNLKKQNVKNGNSLVLTIDSRIQEIVEMNLREGLQTYGAKNAIGILIHPKSGEVVAMASISSTDKQHTNAQIRAMANLGVSFMFEPGSTLKPFTSLVALEKKLYKATDMIDCRTYHLKGRTIRDAHPFDDLSFRDVIVHSSNVGISKVAEEVGENALYDRLISLNFGNRTSSDFYGESAGQLRKVREWQGFSLHSISFGQEIAVTPLQLASAYATLANDGIVMKPYVVKEVLDENGKVVKRATPQRIRKVSNTAAIDTLRTMLEDVVAYGTGTGTKLPYVSIAGKTGTAEKQTEGKGYTKNKYISNFAGFFPSQTPEYAGVIIYDEPSYAYHYASMSAAVSFRKIVEQILALPDCTIIPNLKLQEKDFVSMPDVMGLPLAKAEQILNKNDINYKLIGDPNLTGTRVINQYPKGNINFDKTEEVLIVIERESVDIEEVATSSTMPSLVGLTVRTALQEAKRHNVNIEVAGRGVITSQSIPVGRTIGYGEKCKLTAR